MRFGSFARMQWSVSLLPMLVQTFVRVGKKCVCEENGRSYKSGASFYCELKEGGPSLPQPPGATVHRYSEHLRGNNYIILQ